MAVKKEATPKGLISGTHFNGEKFCNTTDGVYFDKETMGYVDEEGNPIVIDLYHYANYSEVKAKVAAKTATVK